MKLLDYALQQGGLAGWCSLIIVVILAILFVRPQLRLKRAQARKEELQGDEISLNYFIKQIDKLTDRVEELEAKIEDVEGKNKDYKEAIYRRNECACDDCPILKYLGQ